MYLVICLFICKSFFICFGKIYYWNIYTQRMKRGEREEEREEVEEEGRKRRKEERRERKKRRRWWKKEEEGGGMIWWEEEGMNAGNATVCQV